MAKVDLAAFNEQVVAIWILTQLVNGNTRHLLERWFKVFAFEVVVQVAYVNDYHLVNVDLLTHVQKVQ